MTTLNYKLRKANDFKYQVKDGRKVVDNIVSASGKWCVCCKSFDTVKDAVSYLESSLENMYSAFSSGDEYKVTIEGGF